MNRLVLLFFLLLLASWRQAKAPEVVTVYDTMFELLHGRVKLLTEYSYPKYRDIDSVVTIFDKKGDAIERKTLGGCSCTITMFYKYDKQGKKVAINIKQDGEERILKTVYKFDRNNRLAEEITPTKLLDVIDSTLVKYDAAGNTIQKDHYRGTEHGQLRFRYNDKNLLIETDRFDHDVIVNNNPKPDTLDKAKIPNSRMVYQYKSFDAMGNWLKRLAIDHQNPAVYFGDKPTDSVITTVEVRKISYY